MFIDRAKRSPFGGRRRQGTGHERRQSQELAEFSTTLAGIRGLQALFLSHS